MKDASLSKKLFQAVAKLLRSGAQVSFVHGGGPEIDTILKRLAIEPKKYEGLRVTDAATMEVVEMVLAAKVNKALVSDAQQAGLAAVGLSGLDGGIATVTKKSADLGLVGTVEKVDVRLLKLLQSEGYFPIVCSIAQDQQGQHMNVNADELAAALAGALQVDLFVLITDVPGLMSNYPDTASLIPKLAKSEVSNILTSGSISSGMIPKVQACADALTKGAKASLITDMLYSDIEGFLTNHEQPQGTLID